MSPPSRQRSRRRRNQILSVVVVLAAAVGSLAGVVLSNWSPKLGLDLAGGLSAVYSPAHKVSTSKLSEAATILGERIGGLGVSGAQVNTQGGTVVVSVPGITDGQKLLGEIGQTAQLFFRHALCYAPPYTSPAKSPPKSSAKAKGSSTGTKTGIKSTRKAERLRLGGPIAPGTPTASAAAQPLPTSCPTANSLTTANLSGSPTVGQGVNYASVPVDSTLAVYPSTPPNQDNKAQTVLLPVLGGGGERLLLAPAELTGTAVKSASAALSQTGQWVVNVTLTGSGATGWNTMAQTYFHEVIGMELDGIVQSAPITLPNASTFTSFGSNVQISGSFTQSSAQQLALALQYGALPVRLNQETAQTVTPTLGHSALVAGLGAGLVGLLLVLLYSILYYRLLGVVVLSGLAVTGALLYAIISALGHTAASPSFDLAGVTGIIVSIGITVDSYIVYFERLKDEARGGKTVRTSVDRGFHSAWRTVLAADTVSLVAAVVLFVVAVGQVKGFAFFLGLSTLMDILMTWFFTRPLVILLGQNERLTSARRIGISSGLAIESGTHA